MRQRIFYLDVIKGTAIFFVVMLHIAALGLSREEVGSQYWNICNIFDSLCRCTVPLFIMVSGVLLLQPSKPFNLRKSIKRLVFPLIIWSALYAFCVTLNEYRAISVEWFLSFLKLTFVTPTHNYFLYLLLGVYLIVPFLKSIVGKKELVNYIILLWGGVLVIKYLSTFQQLSPICSIFNRLELSFPVGYVGYFVLGYKLQNIHIQKTQTKMVILSTLAVVLLSTIVMFTYMRSNSDGFLCQVYYDYMNPFVVLYSSCVFLLCRLGFEDNRERSKRVLSGFERMSKYSLAIYMFHMFVIVLFLQIDLNYRFLNPWISIPLLSVMIYAISFGVVFIGERIPFFKKYMM